MKRDNIVLDTVFLDWAMPFPGACDRSLRYQAPFLRTSTIKCNLELGDVREDSWMCLGRVDVASSMLRNRQLLGHTIEQLAVL
jgi:hypothetical protein